MKSQMNKKKKEHSIIHKNTCNWTMKQIRDINRSDRQNEKDNEE